MNPKRETELRVLKAEQIEALYAATAAMDMPDVPGVRPPAWWRALIAVALGTGLRQFTLFALRTDNIDWAGRRLFVLDELAKSREGLVLPLDERTMEYLQAMRTPRELLFPWGSDTASSRDSDMAGFYRQWHKLLAAAGIPAERRFGLHALRRTAAAQRWAAA